MLNLENCNMRYQNVTYPENRGTAFALFNLSDDIGKGGGPVLVALLVRIFGDRRYYLYYVTHSTYSSVFKHCIFIYCYSIILSGLHSASEFLPGCFVVRLYA